MTTMIQAAENYTLTKPNWFVIEFCGLGFIGKLFRTKDLHTLIQYFLLFYKYKPVDWLLEDLLRTMLCGPMMSNKECNNRKKKIKILHKPSLFQHIGHYSSLIGKIQDLKDESFDKSLLLPGQSASLKFKK